MRRVDGLYCVGYIFFMESFLVPLHNRRQLNQSALSTNRDHKCSSAWKGTVRKYPFSVRLASTLRLAS